MRQYHVPACLRVAIEAHVVETLREADGQGLHVNEIAKSSAIDPAKLGAFRFPRPTSVGASQGSRSFDSESAARVLRLLAAYHIFRETSPDVFANNRTSVGLDTGKSVKDLKAYVPHLQHLKLEASL